jgi:uncharacterized protein (DUF433 family)
MEIKDQETPLHADAEGTIRIGKTRVPLETVIEVFDHGATPEEIVQRFPVLHLADVYATISYYLHHYDEVQHYMTRQREHAESVREQVGSRSDVQGLRERLLARKEAEEGRA